MSENLNTALAAVQTNLPHIQKTKTATGYRLEQFDQQLSGFRYACCDALTIINRQGQMCPACVRDRQHCQVPQCGGCGARRLEHSLGTIRVSS